MESGDSDIEHNRPHVVTDAVNLRSLNTITAFDLRNCSVDTGNVKLSFVIGWSRQKIL